MAKNDAPAEKTSRLKQIRSAYQLTKKSDPWIGLLLAETKPAERAGHTGTGSDRLECGILQDPHFRWLAPG